jgi:hypothetical protein
MHISIHINDYKNVWGKICFVSCNDYNCGSRHAALNREVLSEMYPETNREVVVAQLRMSHRLFSRRPKEEF